MTVDQLEDIVQTYVNDVYVSGVQELYDVLMYQYRHVQRHWSSLRAERDRAAVRDLVMQLLADGHQV